MRPNCGDAESGEFSASAYFINSEVIMKKTIRRIAAVVILILAALVISYLVYTGVHLHA